MPLQNRVTPFSTIEATPQRGLFMGNRGCLHNERRELISAGWRTKRWIICELNFRGIHREMMQPRQYTELFFLDEAVALAAGHRPCAFCRRAAFNAFVTAWSAGCTTPASASVLDATLHRERVPPLRGQPRWQAQLSTLPNGTRVVLPHDPGRAWLKLDTRLLAWSHAGYTHAERPPGNIQVAVLTPFSTVRALRAGYTPFIHPGAATL